MVVPDEERSEPGENCTQMMVRDGLRADFVVCGEPTDMLVGIQAKGVLMMRVDVPGTAAHGATPWLGDSAILRGVRPVRRIEGLPFAAESAPLFERPSINLGRIAGGDAVNKVPDQCRMDVDVRYLPGQHPEEVLAQVRALDPAARVEVLPERPPANVPPDHPVVQALLDAAGRYEPSTTSVGRDGASDAVAFLEVGVPAVEFGPRGGGHHGPEEYVEIDSLPRYRRRPGDFARIVAGLPVPSAEAGAACEGPTSASPVAPPEEPPHQRALPDAAPAQAVAGARGVEPLHDPRAGRRDEHRGATSTWTTPSSRPRRTRAAAKAARAATRPVLPGEPTNILLIGSDTRPNEGDPGRSDSLIFVRMDPRRDFISMLSFPRDSYVPIPGVGTAKINEAYSYGPARRSRPSRRSPGNPSTTT